MVNRTPGSIARSHVDITGKQEDVITTRGDIIIGSSTGAAARLALGTDPQYLGNNGTDVIWDVLPTASDGTAGILETATQAEQETGTATDKMVTPGRQHFHQSAAKAWINFAIDGTDNASFNVASITDNGVGDWSVNIATDMSGTAYLVLATAHDDMPSATSNHSNIIENTGRTKTAGVFHILNFDIQATPVVDDPVNVSAMAFGDQ